MAKAFSAATWQRALVILTATVVAVVVITTLYWAQTVFIPVALAVFMTFLLSPPVQYLQRHGLGRVPSVLLVVAVAGLLLLGTTWMAGRQVRRLIGELPGYTGNITTKIRSARDIFTGPDTENLSRMMRDISDELKGKPSADTEGPHVPSAGQPTVTVQPESPAWIGRLPAALSVLLQPLGVLALAAALSVFMLFKREDLRNRFIRLIGRGHLTVTTKTVDDAGARISRYLLRQFMVNCLYGTVFALGLYLIGVEYAALWGVLIAVLRYVPYLGAPLGALMPFLLSVAMSQGWAKPLMVVGLLVLLEVFSNSLLEPWLYSHTVGVSEVALLVAAAFWTWLWGPVGLLLATPLTVCLVVLGRHVPQLKFIDVLLGDQPALAPDVALYQRLLARDEDEASEIALQALKDAPPDQVYDTLLIPALTYAKDDRLREAISEDDEGFVLQAAWEIVEDVIGVPSVPVVIDPKTADRAAAPATGPRVRLLGCPARDREDHSALEMLRYVLNPAEWDVVMPEGNVLHAEVMTLADEVKPGVICVGSLPPGGMAHTRFLCKRLRARFPNVRIIVGRWGHKGVPDEGREQLTAAGADEIATTLLETRTQLSSLRPVLLKDQKTMAAEAEPAGKNGKGNGKAEVK